MNPPLRPLRRMPAFDSSPTKPVETLSVTPFDFADLRRAVTRVETRRKAVGVVNPRPPGLHNRALELFKKLIARSLDWYTRPLWEFHASISQSLTEIYSVVEHLSADALDEGSVRQQLRLLQEQVRALVSIENLAIDEASTDAASTSHVKSQTPGSPCCPEIRLGNDRTAYIVGLFGTGRLYLNELILRNIGTRLFRDEIRFYPLPTSVICSGHATVKYLSRGQAPPKVTRRIVEAVKMRFADSIFIYRHPLDSLLTNWVFWRTYLHENRPVCGISEVYENRDDLCADLDRNFSEFLAFAQGCPEFYAGMTGPRFLSFAEFVEETVLHHESATLTLRLEDFMADPVREFSKVTGLLSVDLDLIRPRMPPPRSKPYGYLAAREKVQRFRSFVDRLGPETMRGIEKIGYSLSG
jgi:hypothetical protein